MNYIGLAGLFAKNRMTSPTFSRLFNVYIKSMHVKLVRTTFRTALTEHRFPPSREKLKVSPNFSARLTSTFARISFPFSETTSGEIRLRLMQPSFLRDRLRVRDPTGLRLWSGRSVSNFCSQCFAKVLYVRVISVGIKQPLSLPPSFSPSVLSLSFSCNDIFRILQPVIIVTVRCLNRASVQFEILSLL